MLVLLGLLTSHVWSDNSKERGAAEVEETYCLLPFRRTRDETKHGYSTSKRNHRSEMANKFQDRNETHFEFVSTNTNSWQLFYRNMRQALSPSLSLSPYLFLLLSLSCVLLLYRACVCVLVCSFLSASFLFICRFLYVWLLLCAHVFLQYLSYPFWEIQQQTW